MVVAGHSAGSVSIASYLYAYPDDPIVVGAIMMSGQPIVIGARNDTEFERIASVVGCRDQSDRQKELECMQEIDSLRLKRAISNVTFAEQGLDVRGGTAFHDNVTAFPPEVLQQRAQEGQFAQIVCIVLDANFPSLDLVFKDNSFVSACSSW